MSEKQVVTLDCDLIVPEDVEKVFENQHIRLEAGIKCDGKMIFKDCEIEPISIGYGRKSGRNACIPGCFKVIGTLEMDGCKIIQPGKKFLVFNGGTATVKDTEFILGPVDSADAVIDGSGELQFEGCTFVEEPFEGEHVSHFTVPLLTNGSITDKTNMSNCTIQNVSRKIYICEVSECSFTGCADIECAQISSTTFKDCEGISATDGHIENCNFSRVKHVMAVRANIDNCKFQQLESDAEDEGIIFVEDSKVTQCTFDNVDLRNNSYLIEGVGDSSIEDCQFTDCRTDREDAELCRMEQGKAYIQEEAKKSVPMGLFRGALKLAGSAALAATGIVSTVAREALNGIGADEAADLVGRAQDASFEKIRDMWTPDEQKDDEYYEAQAERSERRAESAIRSAEQFKKRYEKEKAKFEREHE